MHDPSSPTTLASAASVATGRDGGKVGEGGMDGVSWGVGGQTQKQDADGGSAGGQRESARRIRSMYTVRTRLRRLLLLVAAAAASVFHSGFDGEILQPTGLPCPCLPRWDRVEHGWEIMTRSDPEQTGRGCQSDWTFGGEGSGYVPRRTDRMVEGKDEKGRMRREGQGNWDWDWGALSVFPMRSPLCSALCAARRLNGRRFHLFFILRWCPSPIPIRG